jgi:hypothetical protein
LYKADFSVGVITKSDITSSAICLPVAALAVTVAESTPFTFVVSAAVFSDVISPTLVQSAAINEPEVRPIVATETVVPFFQISPCA